MPTALYAEVDTAGRAGDADGVLRFAQAGGRKSAKGRRKGALEPPTHTCIRALVPEHKQRTFLGLSFTESNVARVHLGGVAMLLSPTAPGPEDSSRGKV